MPLAKKIDKMSESCVFLHTYLTVCNLADRPKNNCMFILRQVVYFNLGKRKKIYGSIHGNTCSIR
jgi:hypothetical protein